MDNNSNVIDFNAHKRKHWLRRMFKTLRGRMGSLFCSDETTEDGKKNPVYKGSSKDRKQS